MPQCIVVCALFYVSQPNIKFSINEEHTAKYIPHCIIVQFINVLKCICFLPTVIHRRIEFVTVLCCLPINLQVIHTAYCVM